MSARSARSARSLANHRLRNTLRAQGEHIERRPLYLRDHGICGLCGERIERLEDATIDHIRPLSCGGTHTWENVQIAHYACNQDKGNRVPEEAA